MPRWSRYAAWGVEASYGVPVAVTRYLRLYRESFQLQRKLEMIRPERVLAVDRQTDDAPRFVSGSFRSVLKSSWFGHLLRRLIGAPVSTNLAGLNNQHIFTPAIGASVGSSTFEVAKDQDVFQFPGTVLTAMDLSIGLNDWFAPEFQCFAADVIPKGLSELPVVSESSFIAPALAVGISDHATPVSLSITSETQGTWTGRFRSARLRIAYDRSPRLPERVATPQGIVGGNIVEAEADFDWNYDAGSRPMLPAWLDREDSSMVLLIRGHSLGGGYYSSIQFDFPLTKFDVREPNANRPGWGNLSIKIGQSALQAPSLGAPFKITLVNQTVVYV
jgi:hypothetical protein